MNTNEKDIYIQDFVKDAKILNRVSNIYKIEYMDYELQINIKNLRDKLLLQLLNLNKELLEKIKTYENNNLNHE